ncbi:MAG: TetR/AcrR family transcriptional regulator [Ignavibacteriae bacterium]|nr:TetR/AcrR family transcriptional regulator [Ignavibacteriota bacterium]
MDNKIIQEERMKGYFIQATKKILKGEGLKAVNVRNIAREAGYSSATLYNYFNDIKDLIFECVKDFQSECEEIVKFETQNSERGLYRIKKVTISYLKFFVQYPGIFELFFLEKANDLGQKKQTINLIYNFHDKLCENEWKHCIENNICTKEIADLKMETLKNLSVGILLFYLNRFNPANYNDFVELTERQLDSILN